MSLDGKVEHGTYIYIGGLHRLPSVVFTLTVVVFRKTVRGLSQIPNRTSIVGPHLNQ